VSAAQDAVVEFAARYRAWDRATGDKNVLVHMDPIEQRDAAWECEHGKLASDRRQTCTCWGASPTPDLMTTFKRAEEAAMHNGTAVADPDAPWGRKNDGSPRKRPGRKPASACAATPAPAATIEVEADPVLSAVEEIDRRVDAANATIEDVNERIDEHENVIRALRTEEANAVTQLERLGAARTTLIELVAAP
jgi:hypothetical protein